MSGLFPSPLDRSSLDKSLFYSQNPLLSHMCRCCGAAFRSKLLTSTDLSVFLTSGVKHISFNHLHREVSPHSLDTYYESHGQTHTHIHTRLGSHTYTPAGATMSRERRAPYWWSPAHPAITTWPVSTVTLEVHWAASESVDMNIK